MLDKMVTFDQPLNEPTRICLRLEHLFHQVLNGLRSDSEWGSRDALAGIIEILNVIDRSDLKTKLAKALSVHASSLSRLERSQNVDKKKLRAVLDQLDSLIDGLYASRGKIGQPLTTNEFLSTIRQHLRNPGGACPFNTPAYHLWLQQHAEKRVTQLQQWYDTFGQIRDIVDMLLKLIRNRTIQTKEVAHEGFYQQNLDSNSSCEMVSVTIPVKFNIFPEISVGRQRLSLRFLELQQEDDGKSKQTAQNVHFVLYKSILMPKGKSAKA